MVLALFSIMLNSAQATIPYQSKAAKAAKKQARKQARAQAKDFTPNEHAVPAVRVNRDVAEVEQATPEQVNSVASEERVVSSQTTDGTVLRVKSVEGQTPKSKQ